MREMKDSGVEWIGEIPRDWDAGSFGNIILQNDGGVWGADPNGYSDSIVLRSTEQTIDGCWSIEEPAKRDLSDIKTPEYYRCRKDDLLITKSSGSDLHIGKTTIVDEQVESLNCYYSNFIQRVRLQTIYSAKYYWYVLNSDIARSQFSFLSFSTSGLGNINSKTVKKMYVPFPPTLTQHQIAAYLDAQCARIDQAIARQQEVIEKLKEYKLAVITEAVTKGLNPDVPMKDSGIEWIGQIPEGWDILRGKFVLELLNRPVAESDEVVTCFRDGEVTLRSNRREDGFTFALKEIGYQGIKEGDLVIHGMDGFAGAIGISDSDGKGSPVLVVCNSKQNKLYIAQFLRVLAYRNVFLALSTGIRERSCDLGWKKIAETLIVLPPLCEQQEIVNLVQKETGKINTLIKHKLTLIDKLTEYKKSLIYEVVTGKREV